MWRCQARSLTSELILNPGSCASYTQRIADGISTFTTSKGPCAFTAEGVLTCAAGNTAASFVVVSHICNSVSVRGSLRFYLPTPQDEAGTLVYQSSGDFSAEEVPPTNIREPIFIGSSKPIGLNLVFSATAIAPPADTTSTAASSTTAEGSTVATSAVSSREHSIGNLPIY